MKKNYNVYFGFIILLVLLYFPIFGFLDTLPIRMWDEARMSINAYEMNLDNNLIVTHYEGKPEMYSTKPPLLQWFQLIFIKLIGINELSIRLPSAISGFLTCLLILFIAVKYFEDFWFGFIAVIILVTSQGYIGEHVVRSGDFDALLTFCTALYCLSFFLYLQYKKTKYLYITFIGLSLAFLTKSIAGLMFIPGLFIYSLIDKQFLSLLKNKHFFIGIGIFIFSAGGYFILREYMNPGYIIAANNNDIAGRYFTSVNFHQEGFWFYFHYMVNERFASWYILVPCGILLGLFHKNEKIFRLTLFSSLLALTYFLVISSAKTKLLWYDAQLYPFLAIIIAVFIHFIFNTLNNTEWLNINLKYKVLGFIFLFLIFLNPYMNIIDKTYKPEEISYNKDFYRISYFMRDALHNKFDINNYYLAQVDYRDQNYLYMKLLKEKGKKIDFKDWHQLDEGDKVIAHQANVKDFIEKNYNYDVIKDIHNIRLYKIKSRLQKNKL